MSEIIASSVLDLIGNTPLLELKAFARETSARETSTRVLAKLEMFNPMSIKDRPVLNMIRGAEERGELVEGGTLVEATSGNTGMALAYIGGLKGYRVKLFMSEAQSVERRNILAALGAELVLTPAEEGTKGAKERASEYAKSSKDYFYVCQHHNLDNREAHLKTTGPEIWRDTDGNIDVLVAGLGTCGTLCGAAQYLKSKNSKIRTVGVEPEGAALVSRGEWRPHGIMGISPGFITENLERDLVDEIVTIKQEDAYQACRDLAQKEGLLVGISSGANAHVAKAIASNPDNAGKTIVCIFADTGERYLSVEGLFK